MYITINVTAAPSYILSNLFASVQTDLDKANIGLERLSVSDYVPDKDKKQIGVITCNVFVSPRESLSDHTQTEIQTLAQNALDEAERRRIAATE